MNALIVGVFAALAVCASAGLVGHSGAIVSGPSGIVTGAGPIGPASLGLGHGLFGGHGGYGGGLVGGLGGLGYGGHGAIIAAPVATSYSNYVSHPVAFGYGGHGGLGYGGNGGIGYGLGHGAVVTNGGGVIGVSGHGVSVHGPRTVPAVISGPSGKIVAHGLYGVPHGHHGW